MKKNILLVTCMFLSIITNAQTDSTGVDLITSSPIDSVYSNSTNKVDKEISHWIGGADIQSVQFLNLPDGIKQKFSTGGMLYFQYKFPIVKSNIMIEAGLGVSNIIMNFNGTPGPSLDSTYFGPNLDSTYFIPLDKDSYKENKMNFTFIDVPVDLRFATGPDKSKNGWLLAFGFSAGLKVDDFIKTSSKDINGDKTKIKTYYTKNLLSYHYGLRARVGYGNFCVSGYYNLTNLFETNQGPEINYYTVGITLGGF